MGACASRPLDKAEEDAGLGAYGPQSGVSVSRRYMVATPENGKRSTADVITSAFLAQTESQREPAIGIVARLASRLGVEDRRGSSHATTSGIALPSSELLGDRPLDASGTAKKLQKTASRNVPAPLGPSEDSFELSRAEAIKRLAIMQKSFKGSGSPAWAFSAKKRCDSAEAPAGSLGPLDGRVSSQSAGCRISGSGGSSNGGGDVEGAMDGGGWRSMDEDVVPIDKDIGSKDLTADAAVAAAEGSTAAFPGSAALFDIALGDARVATGGCESSRRSERCATPRRDDEYGSCFRTVSISRMQCPSKATAGEGSGAAAAGAGAAAGADAPVGTNTDLQPETDELTSLPLPNLVSGNDDARRISLRQGPPPAMGHRYSAASYVHQSSLESKRGSVEVGAANRNSDLGYYLEEARFASSSPLQGSRPVRHNLLDSPMIRQRATKEAEESSRPAPMVLDYVPSTKSQPARGSLLTWQSSQKQRLPGGSGAGQPDDEEGDGGGRIPSRRLEYVPTKSLSRKFSHANTPSGSILLVTAGGSSSRPMSPVSRNSLASPKAGDYFPSCPQATGGDNERCFHVVRSGAAVAAGPVSSSGGLPISSPLAAARRRGDAERRISISASQVPLAHGALQQVVSPATLSPPPAALRSATIAEHPRSANRPATVSTLDPHASAQQQQLAGPTLSRLHVKSSGGSIVTGSPGVGVAAVKRFVGQDVIVSAAWAGPSLAAPIAPGTLSASSARMSRPDAARADGSSDHGFSSIASHAISSASSASRTVGRAAKLLATLQRMGPVTPEVAGVQ